VGVTNRHTDTQIHSFNTHIQTYIHTHTHTHTQRKIIWKKRALTRKRRNRTRENTRKRRNLERKWWRKGEYSL